MMMMVNVPWDQNLVYRTLKKKINLFVLKLYFYAQRAWREASQVHYNFDKFFFCKFRSNLLRENKNAAKNIVPCVPWTRNQKQRKQAVNVIVILPTMGKTDLTRHFKLSEFHRNLSSKEQRTWKTLWSKKRDSEPGITASRMGLQ